MTMMKRALRAVPDEVWWVAAALVLALGFRVAFPRRHYDEVYTGATPVEVAEGADGVWALNLGDRSVTLIDPSTAEAVFTTVVGDEVGPALAAGDDGAWVLVDGGRTLVRVDAASEAVGDRFDLRAVAEDPVQQVVAAGDRLWVGTGTGGTLTRLDPATGEAVVSLDVGADVARPQLAGDALWVLRPDGLAEYDALTGERRRIVRLAHEARDVVVGADTAYLLTQVDPEAGTGVVVAVDLDGAVPERSVTVADAVPSRLGLGPDTLFVSGAGGMLVAIDLGDFEVTSAEQVTRDAKTLLDLQVAGGVVWVADGLDAVAHQPVDGIEGEPVRVAA